MEQEEYRRREKGTSSAVIPSAIRAASGNSSANDSSPDHVAGAVSGTDSESDAEWLNKIKGNRVKKPF